ncbi:MAG: acylneuraminate cytidylyltransferase family protein [Candidatus Paceibacterota bacterium]
MTKIPKYNILAVITARGGSKGIPRKNIIKFIGKPLLAHVLQKALKSKYITRVVVSSEDNEILSVAKKYGGKEVILKRPEELARDNSLSLPVVQHAVKEVEKKDKVKFDFIILLQPTTPLMTIEDIDNAIEKLIKTKADTVVSVCEINDAHPIKIKKIVNDKLVQYVDSMKENIFRRQDMPKAYKRNGGIYANKRNVVMKENSLYGIEKDCRAYIMPRERSIDINSIEDLYLAEIIYKKYS